MSGGSYDYFYSRVREQLHTIASTLEDMAFELETSVPSDTEEEQKKLNECAALLKTIAAPARMMSSMFDNDSLTELLRVVEWWRSGDYSYDRVIEAFEKVKP